MHACVYCERLEDTSELGCCPRKDLFVVLLHLYVAFLRLGGYKLLVRPLLVNLQQMETIVTDLLLTNINKMMISVRPMFNLKK